MAATEAEYEQLRVHLHGLREVSGQQDGMVQRLCIQTLERTIEAGVDLPAPLLLEMFYHFHEWHVQEGSQEWRETEETDEFVKLLLRLERADRLPQQVLDVLVLIGALDIWGTVELYQLLRQQGEAGERKVSGWVIRYLLMLMFSATASPSEGRNIAHKVTRMKLLDPALLCWIRENQERLPWWVNSAFFSGFGHDQWGTGESYLAHAPSFKDEVDGYPTQFVGPLVAKMVRVNRPRYLPAGWMDEPDVALTLQVVKDVNAVTDPVVIAPMLLDAGLRNMNRHLPA